MECEVDVESINLLPRLQRLLKCIREHNDAEALRAASSLAEEISRIRATVSSVPGSDITEREQRELHEEMLRKTREQDTKIQHYRAIIDAITAPDVPPPPRKEGEENNDPASDVSMGDEGQ